MMRVAFALFGFASAHVAPSLTPAEVAAKLEQQTRDLSMPDANRIPSSCAAAQCPDMSEICSPETGLEVRWSEGHCCPMCASPGWEASKELNSAHLVAAAATAPVSCKNAKCFELLCQDREKVGPPPAGGCCNVCVKV